MRMRQRTGNQVYVLALQKKTSYASQCLSLNIFDIFIRLMNILTCSALRYRSVPLQCNLLAIILDCILYKSVEELKNH